MLEEVDKNVQKIQNLLENQEQKWDDITQKIIIFYFLFLKISWLSANWSSILKSNDRFSF